jgi:DNA polymerase-1
MKKEIITSLDIEKINIQLQGINWDTIALDTETTSLEWYDQKLEAISICDGETALFADGNPIIIESIMKKIQEETKVIICHNITFDMKVLFKYGYKFLWDKEWVDTMVMAHLVNENGEHSLKKLAKSILEYDTVEYIEAKKNREKFIEYAINDAVYTWELAQYFRPKMVEDNTVKLFRHIEMPFLKVLAKMEMNGVKVDIEKVSSITTELKETLIELEMKMLKELQVRYDVQYDLNGGIKVVSPINFNSSIHLSKILFEQLGLQPVKTTETGKISTGRETISKLKDAHPFVALLDKYKSLQKLLSAFFEPLPEHIDIDGRVRPHFNDIGTATGRLSCNNPNLQQLPKIKKGIDINTRSCFVPSEGKLMIALDYSQQELRIMAQLSKDEQLIKIINEGGDIHLINANNVFNLGIPEEELYSTHPMYEKHKEGLKKERDWGKIFSFGVSYGMGPHKLSRDFKVDLEEAEGMLSKFFQKFPKLEESIKKTHVIAEKQGYVATYLGRRRHFEKNQWGKLDSKSLRQAFNFLIQSLGADVIRSACIKIDKLSQDRPDLGITLLATVHDEVLIECNFDKAKEVTELCKELCTSVAPDFICPLLAEAGVGKNYGACK